jgi:four helix bundle protein
MKTDNIIKQKSLQFAIRVVRLYQYLAEQKKEYVLSKQLLRCGTSIGANIHEALQGSSTKDFVYKLNISLKEAHETGYWLKLLVETNYLTKEEYASIDKDCIEIIKILTSIIKTSKSNLNV